MFSDGDFNKLKKSADIGVLLFVGPESPSGCGQAFHIDPVINDVDNGCEHNREEHDSSSNAHGFLMKPPVNSGYRTIMR